jgi:hypothetical protein
MDGCSYCDQATSAGAAQSDREAFLQLLGGPFIIAEDLRRALLYSALFLAN